MNSITILNIGITDAGADCIVNAANEALAAGSGVCGAIFKAAGYEKLKAACAEFGGCPTGGAVITPGFDSKAKYIIHAVGPRWHGGSCGEEEKLMGCCRRALELARENGCHSAAFPLISTGAFGYPAAEAWKAMLKVCLDFLAEEDCGMDVIFAVPNEHLYNLGKTIAAEMSL